MESDVQLVKPALELKEEYRSFRLEWMESGEKHIPTAVTYDPSDFPALVTRFEQAEQGIGLPEGWVPDSTYWLVHRNGRILGSISIRHRLNAFLTNIGGHIGYGIRPSERGKGHAVRMLALALPEAKKLGLERVLITCDAHNIPSERTILRNGGAEDVPYLRENGEITKRFWITL